MLEGVDVDVEVVEAGGAGDDVAVELEVVEAGVVDVPDERESVR